MGNKANQRKKKSRAVKKKAAAPPPYDEHTHLKGLFSLHKTWTRAGDVSESDMKALEVAMEKRHVPKNHPVIDTTTPLSKILDIVARFERNRKEKAFAWKPKHVETGDVLLQLQAEKEDWVGARKTLSAKLKNGQLPRDVHKRRDAVLALSEAKDVLDSGKSIEAREAAIAANKSSPDLIPAACMAAREGVTTHSLN